MSQQLIPQEQITVPTVEPWRSYHNRPLMIRTAGQYASGVLAGQMGAFLVFRNVTFFKKGWTQDGHEEEVLIRPEAIRMVS